ncbi:MAG: hypothetical protein R3F43_24365 [bacterium]
MEAGPQVQNQASLAAGDGVTIRSDDDGTGRDPTIVPVGDTPVRRLTVRKTVEDPPGAPALAGEVLTYRIQLANSGTVDLAGLTVVDDLPPGLLFERALGLPPGAQLEVEPPPAGASQNGRVSITEVGVVAGESATVVLELRVDPLLGEDREICNIAQAEGPGVPPVAGEPACVDAQVRFGGLTGRVFEDVDGDGAFTEDADAVFEGMRVALSPERDPDAAPVAEAESDETGRFDLADLLPGRYRVRVFSATDVLLRTLDGVEVVATEQRQQDLVIDPSGRIYDGTEGSLIDGAQVFIYRDNDAANDDPYDAASRDQRSLVPPEDLEAESMQGQRTAHGGMYRFAVRRPGRYLMEVVPPGLSYVSPSLLVPPTPGYAFTDDPEGKVVPDALPGVRPDSDRTYFLAFDLAGPDDQFFHNHVPIDPLSALIDVQKRSLRAEVTRGQVVTYEIDIVNRSPRDLVEGSESGPAVLQDVLPRGFKYVAGSGTFVRVQGGREVPLASFDPKEARILRFPVQIHAGEALRLRYQAALGANVVPKATYTNRATLLLAGQRAHQPHGPRRRAGQARRRLRSGPADRQGSGDADGDGFQGEGERGWAGCVSIWTTGGTPRPTALASTTSRTSIRAATR